VHLIDRWCTHHYVVARSWWSSAAVYSHRVYNFRAVTNLPDIASAAAVRVKSLHRSSTVSTTRSPFAEFLWPPIGGSTVATLSGNSLRQTVHTHRASVHQAAKLVAVLLRVGVTASLPLGLWLTSPAGWLPRTRISSGTLRSVIEYGLPLPFCRGRSGALRWGHVSVCLSVRSHNSRTSCPNFTEFLTPVTRSRHSDLLWRCWDTLR